MCLIPRYVLIKWIHAQSSIINSASDTNLQVCNDGDMFTFFILNAVIFAPVPQKSLTMPVIYKYWIQWGTRKGIQNLPILSWILKVDVSAYRFAIFRNSFHHQTWERSCWVATLIGYSLQWCHNGRDGVSNHKPHDCLLSRQFRRRSKNTSKVRIICLFE